MIIFRILVAAIVVAGALPAAEPSTVDLTLAALEAYRNGDCKAAVPKLEALLAKQPKNRSARQLLTSCQEGLSAAKPKPQPAAPGANASPEKPKKDRPAAPAVPSVEAKERGEAGADFDKAERLIKAGKFDEAEALLEKVVARSPRLMLPRQRLAEIHTRKKESGKAAAMYAAMASQSKDAHYWKRAAENYSWDRNYPASIDAYDRYLAAAPSDHAARVAKANVLLWAKDLDRAAAAFRDVVVNAPNDVEARAGLAHALLWSKQFAPALDEFEWLKTKRPGELQYRVGAAQALEQLDRTGEALSEFEAVLARDSANLGAREGRARLESTGLQRQAFLLAEKGEFEKSAVLFGKHVTGHPDDTDSLLQLARVEFWGQRYPDSAAHYRTYLRKKPGDEAVLRELARVELSVPDYALAQQHYEALANGPSAKKEDIEGLIAALVWDNKHDAAEPWARKLATLDPASVTAADTLRVVRERRVAATRENAQRLAGEGRFPEAIEAFRDMAGKFGNDRDSMLTVARIYGWDRQLPRAISAYQEYLNRYPADTTAQVELGRVQQYSGDFDSAESTYRAVLLRERNNGKALLGLAQTADQSGQDPFRVADAYRTAFRADPGLREARNRVNELIPEVSPSIGYRQQNFGDSDGFRRNGYSFEGSIPFRGGLRLTPFYLYNDFSQFKRVGGGDCNGSGGDSRASQLSDQICAGDGVARAHSGGVRISLVPDRRFSFTGEASQARFDLGRNRLNAKADFSFHPTADSAVTVGYIRREAVYDVNTIASLYGGVLGETFFAAYRQPISNRWNLSLLGGLTRYDSGTADYSTPTNQRRGSASLTYRVTPSTTAGYFMRVSSFTQSTPLFFSPSLYAVAGATYDWNKRLSESFSLLGNAELGFGRMKRFETAGLNVTEFALYMGLAWRIRPDLNLQLGYRLSRGVSSAFGSPTYRTGGLDFGMANYFARPLQSADPGRIDVR